MTIEEIEAMVSTYSRGFILSWGNLHGCYSYDAAFKNMVYYMHSLCRGPIPPLKELSVVGIKIADNKSVDNRKWYNQK